LYYPTHVAIIAMANAMLGRPTDGATAIQSFKIM
jgi:hypothetical protein